MRRRLRLHSLAVTSLALTLGSGCGDDGGTSASGGSSGGGTSGSSGETAGGSGESGGSGGESSTSGGGSTAGTTSAGTTGSTSATSDTSDTDDTSGLDVPCDDAHLPFAGALCGPPERPCALGADEAVDPEARFRNEAPAIAVDLRCAPEVAFSVAEGGYEGRFARRSAGGVWAPEATPFPLARVGLTHDPGDDAALALTYDGAFGTALWRRAGEAWAAVGGLPGLNTASAFGFARAEDGALHAAVVTDLSDLRYASFDGTWSSSQVDVQATPSAALAVDAEGAPHLAYWSSAQGATWELRYAAPPAAPEVIAGLGSNLLEVSRVGIAAVSGAPHALAALQEPGGLHRLVLARRVGPGAWTVEAIAAEDDAGAKLCAGEPQASGEVCAFDYVRYRPLAIVGSAGGDVRALFARVRYQGSLVGSCTDLPFPVCSWALKEDTTATEVGIAWPSEQGPKWAVVAGGGVVEAATAAVDAGGRIHVAAYERAGLEADLWVRYLRLEE